VTQVGPIPSPHALAVAELAARLGVDPTRGLATADAEARLATHGPNELEPPHRSSVLASIVDAATEPFVVVLALAGVLAVFLGEVRDGLLILVGLVPIVGADVVTQFRAERALEELRAAAAPLASVRRDGGPQECPARELVSVTSSSSASAMSCRRTSGSCAPTR
jgi:magnesium-transporting ATPase (P-type)